MHDSKHSLVGNKTKILLLKIIREHEDDFKATKFYIMALQARTASEAKMAFCFLSPACF